MFSRALRARSDYLEDVLAKSDAVSRILRLTPRLGLANWYLGGGAIPQTIWNELHGFPLDQGIRDYDIVYFDRDASIEAQQDTVDRGRELFADLPVDVEVTNQARVHLWYGREFGKEIRPYVSTEDAIDTWPTTASSVGVRYEGNRFMVYAPFGLNDMMSLVIRANKVLITRDVYERKANRWQQAWPRLVAIPWNDDQSG